MAKFKDYQIGITQGMTIDLGKLLPPDHIAFFVEHCVSQLDTSKIESKYGLLGPSSYHPKLLLSVLFLGYIEGIRSGRRLAKACSEHVAFIYLSKGYFPQKSVINTFRQENIDHFDNYFTQVLSMFKKAEAETEAELLSTKTVIIDGSKLKANASRYQTRGKDKYERWLKYLKEDITEIEEQLAISKKKNWSSNSTKKNN